MLLPAFVSFAAVWAVPVVAAQESAAVAQDISLEDRNSGEKQIEMVDRQFPENGDLEGRRDSLERILRMFPGDRLTVFRASVRLALVDITTGHPQAAHNSLNALLAADAGRIDPDLYGWGEMVDGTALGNLGRVPEALAQLRSLAADPGLSPERRSAAGALASDLESRGLHLRLMGLLSAKPLSDWFRPAASDGAVGSAAFRRAIDKARGASDPATCLGLGLRDLAAHGSGDDFPRRLWETAGYADWLERKQPGSIDHRVCDTLLDLCDGLPEGGNYAVEGKFLRAKRLARFGDSKREQEVLGGIVSIPKLPEAYLAPACKMLGASLEASGDYRGALETYELLESDAERYSSAADCLMSAVMIDLRLGNNDEAVRLIRILQEAPPEVIQGAASASRIREFVDLVKTGRAPSLRPAPVRSPFATGFSQNPPPEDGIDRWIRNAALPWYDYADPQSLDDPRLKDVEEALNRPDGLFKPAEQIKLLLLAARDARRPAERRRQSFREAVRRILEDSPDYRTLGAIASSVVNDAGLDQETRVQTLESTLAILAQAGRRSDYAIWRGNPAAAGFGPEFREKLALLDEEAGVDRESSSALNSLARSIAAKPMTPFGILTMRDLLGFLLRLGDLRSAGELVLGMPAWNLEPDAAADSYAVQTEFRQLVRSADSLNPVHEALAAGLRSHYPAIPDGLPADYSDLRLDLGVPERSPAATFQACRHLVEARQFDRYDFRFWGTALRTLPAEPAGPPRPATCSGTPCGPPRMTSFDPNLSSSFSRRWTSMTRASVRRSNRRGRPTASRPDPPWPTLSFACTRSTAT